MSANYRNGSVTTIPHTPNSDVGAGEMIAVGSTGVAIAHRDIKTGETGALAVGGSGALYEIAKETGSSTAISAGGSVYLDESAQEATSDADGGNNNLIGECVVSATDSDETVLVRHD